MNRHRNPQPNRKRPVKLPPPSHRRTPQAKPGGGCLIEVAKVGIVAAFLATLTACPSPNGCTNGAQRFNTNNNVWQVCNDHHWVDTPNPNPTWKPGTKA